MLKFFLKLLFFLKKPQIIVAESGEVAEAIFNLLEKHFNVGKLEKKLPGFLDVLKNEILIFINFTIGLNFLFQNSRKPILVINAVKENEEIIKLIKILPSASFLVLNYDNVVIRNLRKEATSNVLTFGFWEGSDVQATDMNFEEEAINFKLNYKGGFVPIWLKLPSEIKEIDKAKETIYPYLATASAGIILGLNLVEISQGLR